jgi:nicotinate-nucleotide pyrophosphorylase (carboxylating)
MLSITGTDYLNATAIRTFIDRALKEDMAEGDQSTLAAIPIMTKSKAKLVFKDDGLIAGLELAERIFNRLDKDLIFESNHKDGEIMHRGQTGFTVEGWARSILSGERLVLNCLQRMSGIATKTSDMVNLLQGTKAKLLDTRKTTPNFRLPEKWAVKIGGGINHRFGLSDMIMLKDNHIDCAGGIENAINSTQNYLRSTGKTLKIEIETRNIEEVQEVLRVGGVDVIMLDNMMPSVMKDAVRLIRGKYITEASGGISEQTIRQAAETGVDYISVGSLTHTYNSLDMSLKATTSQEPS